MIVSVQLKNVVVEVKKAPPDDACWIALLQVSEWETGYYWRRGRLFG
jgi:hypothetical protein